MSGAIPDLDLEVKATAERNFNSLEENIVVSRVAELKAQRRSV